MSAIQPQQLTDPNSILTHIITCDFRKAMIRNSGWLDEAHTYMIPSVCPPPSWFIRYDTPKYVKNNKGTLTLQEQRLTNGQMGASLGHYTALLQGYHKLKTKNFKWLLVLEDDVGYRANWKNDLIADLAGIHFNSAQLADSTNQDKYLESSDSRVTLKSTPHIEQLKTGSGGGAVANLYDINAVSLLLELYDTVPPRRADGYTFALGQPNVMNKPNDLVSIVYGNYSLNNTFFRLCDTIASKGSIIMEHSLKGAEYKNDF